ncbi:MAG: UDP-galactose transporter [Chaenotheca gracillima]|nr:MAG: UDP-galactose transporter [Chaenotheca gracillima]
MASSDEPTPFPTTTGNMGAPSTPTSSSHAVQDAAPRNRSRDSSGASAGSRLRSASIKILDANPPSGMWHATADLTSRAPTITDIRRGSFSHGGWSNEGQYERRNSISSGDDSSRRRASKSDAAQTSPINFRKTPRRTGTGLSYKEDNIEEHADELGLAESQSATQRRSSGVAPDEGGASSSNAEPWPDKSEARDESQPSDETPPPEYLNGYVPPPKHTWGQAFSIGTKAFWKFFLTPLGFLVVIYGLNVVAWGGMLFLLLLNASPAMCHPTCNDIQSPRRIWIEIDSQVVNGLFCVTGLGLIPWRFRDLYFLLRWRLFKRHDALQRLAGIHRGWFRLKGSDQLPYVPAFTPSAYDPANETVCEPNPAVPIPASTVPDPPPTGTRATPTVPWKLDFVVWMYVWNTFMQIVLCIFMWHFNRYVRPSWSTGLFVALACIVAGLGGIMVFLEGKRVKNVEGVPEGLPTLSEDGKRDINAGGDVEKAPVGPRDT